MVSTTNLKFVRTGSNPVFVIVNIRGKIYVPIAQRIRVGGYEPSGCRFESCLACHKARANYLSPFYYFFLFYSCFDIKILLPRILLYMLAELHIRISFLNIYITHIFCDMPLCRASLGGYNYVRVFERQLWFHRRS